VIFRKNPTFAARLKKRGGSAFGFSSAPPFQCSPIIDAAHSPFPPKALIAQIGGAFPKAWFWNAQLFIIFLSRKFAKSVRKFSVIS